MCIIIDYHLGKACLSSSNQGEGRPLTLCKKVRRETSVSRILVGPERRLGS
jgi:hypothetical protein